MSRFPKKTAIHSIVVIAALLITFPHVSFSDVKEPEHVLKVKVLQSGKVFADDKVVSLDELDHELSGLKEKEGVVWYYREDGMADPPEVATDVMDLVIKYELPVSFSSQPDFSDYIDDDGSHPRSQ